MNSNWIPPFMILGPKKIDELNRMTEANEIQLEALSEELANLRKDLAIVNATNETAKENLSFFKTANENTQQALSVVKEGFETARKMLDNLNTQRLELSTIKAESEKALAAASRCLEEIKKDREETDIIDEEQKKKAAMALNLCTTSISNIISCGNVEAMEIEYNTILNNINLQAIIKDETLLSTMRTILDTISFFRLQEGDRKRLEERHHQRMNNLLWDTMSRMGGLFIVSGNPYAIAAAVTIQAGSTFIGYNMRKKDEAIKYDDELWNLERSALEQLHALRASLFETAWRLSDIYDFKDEWRLTIPQIDWYNEIRAEPDDLIRYKKLQQYQSDFEVYPYFWYELGVAAHNVFAAKNKEFDKKKGNSQPQESEKLQAELNLWRNNAKQHLSEFLKLDETMGLLRQDVIGADARIRHVSLLAEEYNSWEKATDEDSEYLKSVKRLAVDDPELLLKAALTYAAAYEECSNKQKTAGIEEEREMDALNVGAENCGETDGSDGESVANAAPKTVKDKVREYRNNAISYFQMLVMRGNNLPISSIYLSYLYLEAGKTSEYANLEELARKQTGGDIVLVPQNGDPETRKADLEKRMNEWHQSRCKPLKELFGKFFDISLKLAAPDYFNCSPIDQRNNIYNWIRENDKNLQNSLFAFFEPINVQINETLNYAETSLGIDTSSLQKIAKAINLLEKMQIPELEKRCIFYFSASNKIRDYHTKIYNAFIELINNIRKVYAEGISKIVENKDIPNNANLTPDDINTLLDFHLETLILRCHLTGFQEQNSVQSKSKDYFAFNPDQLDKELSKDFKDHGAFSWILMDDPAVIDYLVEQRWSYLIQDCDQMDQRQFQRLLNLIKARYPKDATTYYDKTTSDSKFTDIINTLISWWNKTSNTVVGESDFEITFKDYCIVVRYCRIREDISGRSPDTLSLPKLESEIKLLALLTPILSDNDRILRLKECLRAWMAIKEKELEKETDPETRQKMIEGYKEELRRMGVELLEPIVEHLDKPSGNVYIGGRGWSTSSPLSSL